MNAHISLAGLILLALALALAPLHPQTAHALFGLGGPEEVKAEGGLVIIPLSKVDDGKAHQFKFLDNGKEIRFFVVKSKDGQIRSAFDACDVCWPAKKGYVQDGDNMVCVNCGQRFHTNRIMEVKGGCNPGPLARTLDQGKVVFKIEDIRAGARYF